MAESLDVSSFVEETLEDERSQTTVLGYDARIRGIKGGNEFPFEMYLHGLVSATTSGSQAAANALTSLLEHCFGGARRGYADEAATGGSHSTTAVEVGTVANFAVGDWIGLEDANGDVHLRQVVTIVGDVLNLHRALPFTPADEDPVHACTVIYPLESRLVDSSSGNYTLSWLVQKGLAGSTASWEALGCVSTVTGITLGRNAMPKLAFNTMVGSFRTPEAAPSPSWSGTPYGAAGLPIGPRTKVFVQTEGTSTENTLHCIDFSVEPGITRTRVETLTEKASGMPGTGLYSLDRTPCNISMSVAPLASSYWTDFEAGTLKHIQFERNAVAGKAWSLYFPKCEAVTPAPGNYNQVLGNTLSFRALNDDGATTITQQRMYIVLC